MTAQSQIVKDLMKRVAVHLYATGEKKRLAEELGISPQSLSNFLSGISSPNATNTLRLLEWVQKKESP